MWSNPAFDPEQAPAEDAVLEAVSTVMVTHLNGAASKYRDGEEVLNPVLIQVDGPGRSLVLDRLEARLDPVAEPASGARAIEAYPITTRNVISRSSTSAPRARHQCRPHRSQPSALRRIVMRLGA